MTINRNNYEEYFLEYYEKTLDPGQVAELMVFLEANPDLNVEFESFEPVKAVSEKIPFRRKKILKKKDYKTSGNISAYNYEEYMVGSIENDLDIRDEEQLKDFLKINPEARLEYDLFKKTRLVPAEVLYPGKAALKKNKVIALYRKEITIALAIAASVLIFIAFYLQRGEPVRPRVSERDFQPGIESIDVQIPQSDKLVEINPRSQHAIPLPGTMGESPVVNADKLLYSIGKMEPVKREMRFKNIAGAEVNLAVISGRDLYSGSLENADQGLSSADRPSFASRFLKGTVNNLFGERERSGKSLLEYTINGYNLMSDRDLEVEKEYDASGRVVAYHVNGELIKFGRKVNPPAIE